ncbi:MAG TPA: hypothetical protein VGO03_13790 [Acidimicrobiia bacterium]|jgi:hypothetical protein
MSDDRVERLRAAAKRIDALPEVVRRSGGVADAVATYMPGDRLVGVRLREGTVEAHVVMAWSTTVDEVERAVVGAVRAEGFQAVDLVIDDIEMPSGVFK